MRGEQVCAVHAAHDAQLMPSSFLEEPLLDSAISTPSVELITNCFVDTLPLSKRDCRVEAAAEQQAEGEDTTCHHEGDTGVTAQKSKWKSRTVGSIAQFARSPALVLYSGSAALWRAVCCSKCFEDYGDQLPEPSHMISRRLIAPNHRIQGDRDSQA